MISLGYLKWNYLKTSLLEYANVLVNLRQGKAKDAVIIVEEIKWIG